MTERGPAIQVQYGEPGAAASGFQHARISGLSVPDIAARLREAIEQADLWMLHEIDPQQLLDHGGYDIHAARQLLFFHPRLLARVLEADPSALLEAPLKIAVMEMPDGGSIIRWIDPVASFARYGSADLTALGQELALLCERIVAEALG
jgi:uncharacterized protein (DUF302 family)